MKHKDITTELAAILLLICGCYKDKAWVIYTAIAMFFVGFVIGILETAFHRREEQKLKTIAVRAESEVVGRMSKALAVAYKALNIACKGENEIDTDEKVITLLEQAEKELNEAEGDKRE